MTPLPITRMILDEHGVGYFERRARFTGERVVLSFRVEEQIKAGIAALQARVDDRLRTEKQ